MRPGGVESAAGARVTTMAAITRATNQAKRETFIAHSSMRTPREAAVASLRARGEHELGARLAGAHVAGFDAELGSGGRRHDPVGDGEVGRSRRIAPPGRRRPLVDAPGELAELAMRVAVGEVRACGQREVGG